MINHKIIKLCCVSFLPAVMIFFTACSLSGKTDLREKEFSAQGLSITLTSSFKESTANKHTVVYKSADVVFTALKDDLSALEPLPSVQEYAEAVLQRNQIEAYPKRNEELGIYWFEYATEENGQSYCYYTVVKEKNGTFWLCQFICRDTDYKKLLPAFQRWASSIQV